MATRKQMTPEERRRIVDEEIAKLASEEKEYVDRTRVYLDTLTRPLEQKVTTYVHIGTKNTGLNLSQDIVAGKCPCTVCGPGTRLNHRYMWECYDFDGGAGCNCCSSACT